MWRICRVKKVKATVSNNRLKHGCRKTKENIVTIRDIKVAFPYKPYNIQETYMTKVMTCVTESKNGLLESPTGTGKTLSLLCPLFAWLNSEPKVNNEYVDVKNIFQKRKRIIYASRTHFQLSQIIFEIRKTNYSNINAVVLGSRDQYCLNSRVKQLNNIAAKNHFCRVMNEKDSDLGNRNVCPYFPGFYSPFENDESVYTVSDLVSIGERNNICPYYASKVLMQRADIIFVPYKYLINKEVRESQKIDVKDNIVILDEGHNIERALEEAASAELSSKSLAACIEYTETLYKEAMATSEATQNLKSDVVNLNRMLYDLQDTLNSVMLLNKKITIDFPNTAIYRILSDCSFDVNVVQFNNIITHLVEQCTDKSRNWSQNIINCLEEVKRFLSIIYSNEFNPKFFIRNYKVFAVKHRNDSSNMSSHEIINWTLNVMCLTPSVAMNSLMECSPRSLIVTGATLTPLQTFEAELNVSFPIRLQSGHIIDSSNLQVFTVESGKCGVESEPFNSAYSNRKNAKYYYALGNAVVKFIELIPDGVFVFFPSYDFMSSCINHWKNSDENILNSLTILKNTFIESSDTVTFERDFRNFKAKIKEEKSKGAIFFGVCRGKLAEGLDAPNQYCRAVVIVGLPYLPQNEHRVYLKRKYLSENRDSLLLTPKAWYRREMTRVVQQAIGRIIRHRDDYGVVILLDNRFSRIIPELSPWILSHCSRVSLDESSEVIRNFFNNKTYNKFIHTHTSVKL